MNGGLLLEACYHFVGQAGLPKIERGTNLGIQRLTGLVQFLSNIATRGKAFRAPER